MDQTQIMIVLAAVAFMIGIVIYFIPSIIAFRRDAASRWIIFFVNFFLGWTLLTWIIILIWSCEGRRQ